MLERAIKKLSRGSTTKGIDGSRSYRASIEYTETSSMDQEVVEKLLRLNLKNLNGSRLQKQLSRKEAQEDR